METVKGPDSKEQRIEHMVTLYQLPLLRLCVMYLHDEEQAKDAVQETFIKAYRNLDSFRAESSERTWLTRIAINTCKDMLKSAWYQHNDRRVCPEDFQTVKEEETEDEEAEALGQAIMKLPAKYKDVIMLYYFQGMDQEETAEALHISMSSVSRRLKRAREKLRDVLKGGQENE